MLLVKLGSLAQGVDCWKYVAALGLDQLKPELAAAEAQCRDSTTTHYFVAYLINQADYYFPLIVSNELD
jgi:hypothetical protein